MNIRSKTLPFAMLAVLATWFTASAQGTTDAFVVKIPGAAIASSVTLATAGGSASGQTVEIPFNLATAGTVAPSSFQIDLTFDPRMLTFTSARAGAQLTAAGKGISSSAVSSSDVRLATTGSNQDTIPNGVVAYASFTLSSQFAGSATVTLVNCISAGALGNPLSTACTAGNITAFTCGANGGVTATVADVQSLLNQALGVTPAVNDLNRDGTVNVADIQKTINAALGLGCPN
jgi:hypothetical protein